MENETQHTLELPKFKVDLNNPIHQQYFSENENGKELEILSIGQYIDKMPKMTQQNDSTILAAISRGLIPAITIKGNRNSFKLVVWCEKSKSYEIVNYRGPNSKGSKKEKFVSEKQPIEVPKKTSGFAHLQTLPIKKIVTEKRIYILEYEGERFVEYGDKYLYLDSNSNKLYAIKKESVKQIE